MHDVDALPGALRQTADKTSPTPAITKNTGSTHRQRSDHIVSRVSYGRRANYYDSQSYNIPHRNANANANANPNPTTTTTVVQSKRAIIVTGSSDLEMICKYILMHKNI